MDMFYWRQVYISVIKQECGDIDMLETNTFGPKVRQILRYNQTNFRCLLIFFSDPWSLFF